MQYLVVALALLAGTFVKAQKNAEVLNYIATYRQLAISEMQRSGVPASIKLAQGIHETHAGKSDLVVRSNNHFGIKCKTGWAGNKVYHDDDERGECFRSYSSSSDSYMDHSDFLRRSNRYAFLFDLDPEDYKAWAYGLKKAGYATNIRYSQILIRLIEEYDLNQYTLIALGKLPAPEELYVKNDVSNVPATGIAGPAVSEQLRVEPIDLPQPRYPSGEFKINNTKVICVKEGTSLLSIAEEHGISYSRLLEFNDMKDLDVLPKDQLLYLQRKRKTGNSEFHIVRAGETLYDICQLEAIRIESLLSYNHMNEGMQPAPGEKLYLKSSAPHRPLLAGDVAINAVHTSAPAVMSPETSVTHIVQTKETLYSISKKYGVDIEKIREWNRLTGFDLKTGQELVILKN
jgi:LysM repeat protein